ncbi:DivIVA domain-containing protein [Actinomadura sp. J1-007]|uniref:DivIVA domain-containing protein n=1 Tax=Actinomadura sp. J1-007 TaxID=2661913 RepID=UPI0035CD089A
MRRTRGAPSPGRAIRSAHERGTISQEDGRETHGAVQGTAGRLRPGHEPPKTRLTPSTVRNKRFTTTRLRPGYAVEEVDDFLDAIEREMERLIRERDEADSRAAARPPAARAEETA